MSIVYSNHGGVVESILSNAFDTFGIVTYEIFLQFLYVLAPISVMDDISSIPLLMDRMYGYIPVMLLRVISQARADRCC